MVKSLPAMRENHLQSLGQENGNPRQYSCLENPMDGGAWQATVHGVAKSWTQLKRLHFTSCIYRSQTSLGDNIPFFFFRLLSHHFYHLAIKKLLKTISFEYK